MSASNASKIKAYIVDDEFHARENLRMMLEDFCPEVECLGQAEGVVQAMEGIEKLKPDLLFLDIRMPSGSEGFELLEKLGKRDMLVIFVTAFKDYAVRAFQANAIHYLLKPVDPEELVEAVQRVAEYRADIEEEGKGYAEYQTALQSAASQIAHPEQFDRITLHHSKGFRVVMLRDLIRLEASGNCTYLHFANGDSYFDTRTLGVYENLLPGESFLRIHKSHIINLSSVREYRSDQGPTAILNDETNVPVSRNRLPDFLQRFKNR